jgi:quinol monooxygenase YgiN
MHILIVHGHVKPEYLDEFVAATKINASESSKEPGMASFDFLQQEDDPTKIVLVEVYKDKEAPVKHKETKHYNEWNAKVEHMWVTPRTRAWYRNAAL